MRRTTKLAVTFTPAISSQFTLVALQPQPKIAKNTKTFYFRVQGHSRSLIQYNQKARH